LEIFLPMSLTETPKKAISEGFIRFSIQNYRKVHNLYTSLGSWYCRHKCCENYVNTDIELQIQKLFTSAEYPLHWRGAGIIQSVASRLRAGQQKNQSSIAGRKKRFLYFPQRLNGLWGSRSLLSSE
jgi:hypothetical protein